MLETHLSYTATIDWAVAAVAEKPAGEGPGLGERVEGPVGRVAAGAVGEAPLSQASCLTHSFARLLVTKWLIGWNTCWTGLEPKNHLIFALWPEASQNSPNEAFKKMPAAR